MPLSRKLAVLTRTRSGNRAWASYLQARGIPVYCLPAIETALLPLNARTAALVKQIADFDWLILTSPTAARYLQTLVGQAGLAWPKNNPEIAAIGSQTARVLQRAGLSVAFQPARPDSVALGAELVRVADRRILLPRTTIASDELAETLRARGAIVTTFPLYDTRILDTPDEQFASLLQTGSIGFLTFASPSAVQGFSRRVTKPYLQTARTLPAIAIGPQVAATLAQHGFRRIYTSTTPSIAGIVEILQQLDRQSGNDLL